jgi:hypothetical protein
MAQKLLEEELRRKADKKAQSLQAASELELERRNILNAMRYREPERGVVHGLCRSSTAPDHSCLINVGPNQLSNPAQAINRVWHALPDFTNCLDHESLVVLLFPDCLIPDRWINHKLSSPDSFLSHWLSSLFTDSLSSPLSLVHSD